MSSNTPAMPKHGLSVEGASFPVTINLRTDTRDQFMHCEEGIYHDASPAKRDHDVDSIHVYVILQRHDHQIEIRSADEALCVYLAACSGTFRLYRYTTAQRICNQLRQFVPAEWLALWPKPKQQ